MTVRVAIPVRPELVEEQFHGILKQLVVNCPDGETICGMSS